MGLDIYFRQLILHVMVNSVSVMHHNIDNNV